MAAISRHSTAASHRTTKDEAKGLASSGPLMCTSDGARIAFPALTFQHYPYTASGVQFDQRAPELEQPCVIRSAQQADSSSTKIGALPRGCRRGDNSGTGRHIVAGAVLRCQDQPGRPPPVVARANASGAVRVPVA